MSDLKNRKYLIYQASILKRCARVYKNSAIVTNNLFVPDVEKLV
jgi:hypothetical protein